MLKTKTINNSVDAILAKELGWTEIENVDNTYFGIPPKGDVCEAITGWSLDWTLCGPLQAQYEIEVVHIVSAIQSNAVNIYDNIRYFHRFPLSDFLSKDDAIRIAIVSMAGRKLFKGKM
jgi:hypothetical protein